MRRQSPKQLLVLGVLLAVCAGAALPRASAHGTNRNTVGTALMFSALEHLPELLGAGTNLAATLVQPAAQALDAKLPSCATTNVLRAEGGFPHEWGSLTAEEQAAHPINLPIMQLAYSVYQPATALTGCLKAMGVDAILPVEATVPGFLGSTATAHVLKAGNDSIFIVFRGSSEITHWIQNMDCGHTDAVGGLFGARNADVRLHAGFYAGWAALEPQVTAAVLEFLPEVPSGRVYLVGHSLGGALASIAALRLARSLPAPANIAGVWLLASPRVGNPTWKAMYNAVLLRQTLRITNFLDVAARSPKPSESCAPAGSSIINLLAPTQQYAYAHVGRSLLMCPDVRTGMVHWLVSGTGSDGTDCPGALIDADATFATHLLGSYFDSWRRGHTATTAASLAADPRLGAVLCNECTVQKPTALAQIAAPARAGGPVTCGVDASCTNRLAWDAATALGDSHSMAHPGKRLVCSGFMCS